MIELHQFPRAFDIPNLSPFCVKVECFLKMAGLDYEVVVVTNPAKGPKGKCPFIADGDVILGDSELIMDYLETTYDCDLDASLTAAQRAVSRAVQGMLDERLYWTIVHSRWLNDANFPVIRETFFGGLPGPLKALITTMGRRGVRKAMDGHGIGRHSAAELYEMGRRDVAALAVLLGDNAYFHGDQPSRVDCCIYSYVVNLLGTPIASPMTEQAKNAPNLAAYNQRINERYFGAD